MEFNCLSVLLYLLFSAKTCEGAIYNILVLTEVFTFTKPLLTVITVKSHAV